MYLNHPWTKIAANHSEIEALVAGAGAEPQVTVDHAPVICFFLEKQVVRHFFNVLVLSFGLFVVVFSCLLRAWMLSMTQPPWLVRAPSGYRACSG